MITSQDVLDFWLTELTPKDWYVGGTELDARIKAQFEETWARASDGGCGNWLTDPDGTLAYILLTDQMSRNMFRDHAAAFETDTSARAAARMALNLDWDLKVPEPQRQFFYLPLMHSENLKDQDDCILFMSERLPQTGTDNVRHARAHRWVIDRFGRFPYRNTALGRETRQDEAVWLDAGGYRLALEVVDAQA